MAAAARAGKPPDHRRRRMLVISSLVALIVGIGVATIVAVGDDDDSERGATSTTSRRQGSVTSTDRTTTSAPSSTSTTPTTGPFDGSNPAVWPKDAAGSNDPVAVARAFATEYLGIESPNVGPYAGGDARSGEVEVRARTGGPATTIMVRRYGPEGDATYSVVAAASPNIELSSPQALTSIASPVQLAGRSEAFEGTVQVEVREDGNPTPLAKTFVTGGAMEMGPFSESVTFNTPQAPFGAIVLYTTSSEDGSIQEATVIRVAFSR